MTKKIVNGFLGSEYLEHYKFIRSKFSDLFELAEDLNKFCHVTLSKLEVDNNNVNDIIVSSLFIKILTDYQGIVILASKGMRIESNSLLRCMIESMFYIIAIQKKEDYVNKYIISSEYDKIRLLKIIEKFESWHNCLGGYESIIQKNNKMNDDFNTLLKKHKLRKKDIRELGTYKLTEEATLLKTEEEKIYQNYYVVYRLLCKDVHSSPEALQGYFSINDLNEIKSINYGPTDKDIDIILNTAIHCMISVLESVNDFFHSQNSKFIEEYKKRHMNLSKKKSQTNIPTRG